MTLLTYSWLTPPAPAAIAVLRVPALPALLDRALPAVGRARFAQLCDATRTMIDEVVASRLRDDVLELSTHGGPGVRAAVNAALATHDLVEQAVVATGRWHDLAAAASPAATRWLLGQAELAFRRELLFRAPIVLITGPTNAGKSTLLNAWCGHARALVSDLPGTTRDLVMAETMVAGWRLRLVDSAGLRATNDALERAGQELVAEARRWADVVIYLQPPGDAGDDVRSGDLIVSGKADLHAAGTGLRWSAHGADGHAAGELLASIGQAVLNRLALPV